VPLEPEATLGRYRLIEKIGEGGMGVVWKAEDPTLGREIAIKVISERVEDSRRIDRLRSEARSLAALSHPNIVTLHSIEEADGVTFLTMEFVRGTPLGKLIPSGGMAPARFFELAIPLVAAISSAHRAGVIHRDLKPDNVVVGVDSMLKVLDFGLAKLRLTGSNLEDTTRTVSTANRIVGTVAYMAPEQIEGGDVDPRSDVFALGVMLWEMLTGQHPFGGGTRSEVVASILGHPPRDVTEVVEGLPPCLGIVIGGCLEKDPGRRPHSSTELRDELEVLRDEQVTLIEEPTPSIAVLPFVDMSQQRDQGYFCEGMAEEIVIALAKIEGLRVASRLSAFRFDPAAGDVRVIGRRLGVRTVLEGSVRMAGDRLRITAQLINVDDGYQLWSERYDRKMEDVFAIQDEIARKIVEALEIELTPRERQVLAKPPAKNVRAYDYYLRGRQLLYTQGEQQLRQALDMFSRAAQLQPNFALAYSGIADARSFMRATWAEFSDVNLELAREAAQKALELDPELAEAHASLGQAFSLGGQHAEAEAAFEKAIRLDPRSFEAHYFYARECFMQGEFSRSLSLFETAWKLRPEDYQVPLLMLQLYRSVGRSDEIPSLARRGVALARRHLDVHPEDARAWYLGAGALARLAEFDRAREWLERALELGRDESVVLYNVACAFANLGSHEEALDALERAAEIGRPYRGWIEHDSDFDPIRDHPRFRALLDRLNDYSEA
jgi:non-specific serine/threonine protein kinase